MNKFKSLKDMATDTGLAEYTLRMYCKQKKIRYNKSGVKYILREDWLEEDLSRMAFENMAPINNSSVVGDGQLRRASI